MLSEGVIYAIETVRQCARVVAYRRAARYAGLTDVAFDLSWVRVGDLSGRKGDFGVRFHDDGPGCSTIVTIGSERIPAALHFECAATGNTYWHVGARPPRDAPAPDARTQRLVAAVLCARLPLESGSDQALPRVAIGGGVLSTEVPAGAPFSLFGPLLRDLVAFGEALCVPGMLVRALRAVLAHPDRHVQLEAALALGDEGYDMLHALITQPDLPDVYAASCVVALGGAIRGEAALTLLRRAADRGQNRTVAALLDVLPRLGDARVAPAIVPVLNSRHAELAIAAARALRRCGLSHAGAEEALVRALARDDIRVRTAAAEALEDVGSVAAVAPLRAAIARWSFDGSFDRAAANAIAMIQARAGGAAPGQLSLAGEQAAGQLSLPDAAAGRLSPATDD